MWNLTIIHKEEKVSLLGRILLILIILPRPIRTVIKMKFTLKEKSWIPLTLYNKGRLITLKI